ncbi:MAG: TetR/AcrR family transcriptional regulator [Bacteroidia bacterium]|nr:TetR/AcrR family transcriptional regulator [Bacteroidia bacterium]
MSRKDQILHAALRLFAARGYDRTPTSLIAKEAGVSSGLIFTHFGDKEGLLAGIIQAGAAQVAETMKPYAGEGDPLEAVLHHIRLSAELMQAHAPFWRLVQQLRFQPEVQHAAAGPIAAFQETVRTALTRQFQRLGAAQPELEALTLFALIDGMTVQYLQAPEQYPLLPLYEHLIQFYRRAYGVDRS